MGRVSNSLEFIRLYNEVAELLSKLTDADPGTRFHILVDRAANNNSVVRRYRSALKRFGNLRNVIVHDECFPKRIVAEVHREVLDEFRRIVELVKAPPRVIPMFRREIRVFRLSDELDECLVYMRDHDYSQIVVTDGEHYRLVSHEGIARWLGEAVSAGADDIRGAILSEVLDCELPESCLYLPREATLFDALEMLEATFKQQRPRVHAILITDTGACTEPPIGIITPWDLIGVKL
jgi:predicted transcriptional regulator